MPQHWVLQCIRVKCFFIIFPRFCFLGCKSSLLYVRKQIDEHWNCRQTSASDGFPNIALLITVRKFAAYSALSNAKRSFSSPTVLSLSNWDVKIIICCFGTFFSCHAIQKTFANALYEFSFSNTSQRFLQSHGRFVFVPCVLWLWHMLASMEKKVCGEKFVFCSAVVRID